MNEKNNQEEEYVEEEIEVYEEVEVDEEEETNDIVSKKQKSKNKINNIIDEKIPTANNNSDENNINNEQKKEDSIDNKLPLLSDKIKSEINENNNISNINNFENLESINTSNKNGSNDFKSDLMNNFYFENQAEENKILNLDYKIIPEKDFEEKNTINNLNVNNQNEIILNQNLSELENKNSEKYNESKKNNNVSQHNFRSKIKRNNKKNNKLENNNRNNNLNNIQLNQENVITNFNKAINELEQNPKINESNIKSLLISDNNLINNNQRENNINNEENNFVKEDHVNNEDTIYNIINNNISYNFDNNNMEKKEENINNNDEINIKKQEQTENEINLTNNEENNYENTKIMKKSTKEEEKYDYIISEIFGNNEIIELFDSKKWEEKKQGFQKFNQLLNENLENDIIKNNFEKIFIFISMKLNNFKETNFNLLKEGIISFNILFSYSKEKNNPIDKKYLEIIISNLNEKICDSKIKENYIQLLNTLNDLYSYKTVYELLFEILLKTNKINVLKEYALFIKDNIKKENSINNFDVKNLIDFSVKLANNTNPQIRAIAIEIIGLLYTFIGPDLKQLISGIKESTFKLIEKEIDKIKYKKDNENKMTDSKIKDLIVKKNKNNNDKLNYNNKRIDISKELTPKLLREINRGKWIEKKEGIEYIINVIDKTNNKISKNGLQELFELIKDKLNDGNQNFVKMILQLLNHLIISLEFQIKFFYNNLVYPLLVKLSDKNKLIRDECLSCIENWIKFQNFEIFAVHIPQLLVSNENLELRIELLNLLTKNKELIKNTYPKSFFKELTKALLTCLQDKNVKIRNITEDLIVSFSNFIPREKYINELKDIKSTISDYLYNIIDKILPKLNEENISDVKTTEEKEKEKPELRQSIVQYDTNNDKDIILVNSDIFSPKKIIKNKHRQNKTTNLSHSLDKNGNNKTKDEIRKNKEIKYNRNTINQNNQMNSTVMINSKQNKIAKNIKSKLMGYDKLSSTLNKKNIVSKINTINIKTEINKSNNQNKNDNNNTKQIREVKKIRKKERNASMIIDNKNNNNILNQNENDGEKKELKSLTAEKSMKTKKITTNNNSKNESFIKKPIKKVNPKKFLNNNENNNGKNKLFLPNYKIKKGVKEKRYEKDKKNNFFSELQNFDYLPKIKESFKNIFNNDFITKLFSNDLRGINSAISQLKYFLDESLNTNNEENFSKLIDNLDLILKVIASKIYNNQTASLIKTFFIFADTLINIYKIKRYVFNDTEINILINAFVDKLTNTNLILKETACNLIWFLNDQIEHSKTFITLVHLLEYKNAKIKSEIIDLIIKLFENSNFDLYVITKVLKILIREYFDSDFSSKKKVLFLLQNIYNIIGNEFWKYTIFLSSKDRDELENYLDIEENDMNYEQKDSSREYDIEDFSGSGFGEDELIGNNNLRHKESNNNGDINQDEIKLHINYFNEKDEKINNNNKINENKNHLFKRSITDKIKFQNRKDEKENQNIDVNNYKTNIPIKNGFPNDINEDLTSRCISEKELLEALDTLTNPEEDLVEAILNIHQIVYRNYIQNKKILIQNSDKIISSFIEIITKLFSTEPLRIKIIKYYILVLCKLCNIKEMIENIVLVTEKNLIVLVLSNLLRENLNKMGENGEGMDIYKSLNSIITHVIEYCDITNNIEIIIELEQKYRKDNPKLAEYSARCLIIILQNIKNLWDKINYQKIFGKIYEILEDFLLENKGLQLKEKTDQTILITLRNLVNELTKAKKDNILDDYNKWIQEMNINNEKYILNWIKESINRININKNLKINQNEASETKKDNA